MTGKVKHLRTETASAVPTAGSLEVGQIAINIADQKLYTKNAAGTVVLVGEVNVGTNIALVGNTSSLAITSSTGTGDGFPVMSSEFPSLMSIAAVSKLNGIETGADVTDATNVAAAGALMTSGGTITGNLTVNGIYTSSNVGSRDKIRVWSGAPYSIGMDNAMSFGGLNDYAMTFQMNDAANRGFWWGHNVHTDAQGAMSLNTDGELVVAKSIRVGGGESDTSAAADTAALDIRGTIFARAGTTFDPDGGAGTDTATNVAYAIESGDRVAGVNSGYIRTLMQWTANGALDIGQTGTSLIGSLHLKSGSSGYTAIYANGSEKARLTGTGLGVGTSSPTDSLEVAGGVRASSTTSGSAFGQISLGRSNATGLGTHLVGNTAGELLFKVGAPTQGAASEAMRIKADGSVAIGTTTPQGLFHVAGLAVLDANTIFGNNNSAFPVGGGVKGMGYSRSTGRLQINNDGDAGLWVGRLTSDGNVVQFYRQGTQVGSISVTSSATAYNTSSDYRLKDDIVPISDAASRIMLLNPVNFAWKADGSRTDGFIAHEAQAVVPEAVTGEKDAVDAEGNPEYQGIDQSKLVPLLTAALQDALRRIEELEAKVN